ncbi:MAG TPA: TIGR02281 family clan AA aspartic protease [Sphingomicrobium sp.]|nr:TIGR02281 family clan AA aspartic protease [Sphingomicrobium sp.]
MQKVALIAVIVLGLFIGLIWTSGQLTSANQPLPNPFTQVDLNRSSDGHFYADAKVNGHPGRFLIDTGASAIALTEADARRAGIVFDPADYEFLGQGASGIVRGKEITLSKLDIDDIGATDVKAVVVGGATVSLLGLPFLNNVDEIVIRKSQMTLRKAG